ncbi:hypothetical protein I4U23_029282 [Adineta vaga]|nr:hypothetical protein I4U23_029282 [Adineta vaga]
MILSTALLINNLGLFLLEIIGYNACHSVVILLDGYYHLCQAILCTVRIASQRIQLTYTPRYTYGLVRVGVVGELVAFVGFFSLSISVFLESLKHLYDVTFVIPKQEKNCSVTYTAHGHGHHHHSLIDYPKFILGIGMYATLSNFVLAVILIYTLMKRSKKFRKQLEQQRPNHQQPLPKKTSSKSLLITDTLPIQHKFLQILNMLLGPLSILVCGILLVISPKDDCRVLAYSRRIDPLIGCFLFLSYLIMIAIPIRDVAHLVLQAKPYGMKSDDIEARVLAIPGVVGIHELHIWRLTPQKTLATVHVLFNTKEKILTKYRDINFIFHTHYIDHVTIQPEFILGLDDVQKSGCYYQCSSKNISCSALQCCENPIVEVPETNSTTSTNKYFHRRSSVGFNEDSDNEMEKKKKLLDESSINISA